MPFVRLRCLIVVMAMSIGIYELVAGRALRRFANEWVLDAAGVASACFAFAFLAFVFRWIKLDPGAPTQSLHWLGCYFGVSAIGMLVLAKSFAGTHSQR